MNIVLQDALYVLQNLKGLITNKSVKVDLAVLEEEQSLYQVWKTIGAIETIACKGRKDESSCVLEKKNSSKFDLRCKYEPAENNLIFKNKAASCTPKNEASQVWDALIDLIVSAPTPLTLEWIYRDAYLVPFAAHIIDLVAFLEPSNDVKRSAAFIETQERALIDLQKSTPDVHALLFLGMYGIRREKNATLETILRLVDAAMATAPFWLRREYIKKILQDAYNLPQTSLTNSTVSQPRKKNTSFLKKFVTLATAGIVKTASLVNASGIVSNGDHSNGTALAKIFKKTSENNFQKTFEALKTDGIFMKDQSDLNLINKAVTLYQRVEQSIENFQRNEVMPEKLYEFDSSHEGNDEGSIMAKGLPHLTQDSDAPVVIAYMKAFLQDNNKRSRKITLNSASQEIIRNFLDFEKNVTPTNLMKAFHFAFFVDYDQLSSDKVLTKDMKSIIFNQVSSIILLDGTKVGDIIKAEKFEEIVKKVSLNAFEMEKEFSRNKKSEQNSRSALEEDVLKSLNFKMPGNLFVLLSMGKFIISSVYFKSRVYAMMSIFSSKTDPKLENVIVGRIRKEELLEKMQKVWYDYPDILEKLRRIWKISPST
jgi:hypothetical protein